MFRIRRARTRVLIHTRTRCTRSALRRPGQGGRHCYYYYRTHNTTSPGTVCVCVCVLYDVVFSETSAIRYLVYAGYYENVNGFRGAYDGPFSAEKRAVTTGDRRGKNGGADSSSLRVVPYRGEARKNRVSRKWLAIIWRLLDVGMKKKKKMHRGRPRGVVLRALGATAKRSPVRMIFLGDGRLQRCVRLAIYAKSLLFHYRRRRFRCITISLETNKAEISAPNKSFCFHDVFFSRVRTSAPAVDTSRYFLHRLSPKYREKSCVNEANRYT